MPPRPQFRCIGIMAYAQLVQYSEVFLDGFCDGLVMEKRGFSV